MLSNNSRAIEGVFEHQFTPDEARQIVEHTIESGGNFRSPFQKNGKTLSSSATLYRDAMEHGRWNWADAAPIRLCDDRRTCTDGLTRLTACWKSGISLRSIVIVGDRYQAGTETDRGKTRSVAQVLSGMGVTQTASTAASTRLLIVKALVSTTRVRNPTTMVHVDDVIELFRKYQDDITWVQGKTHQVRATMNASAYASMLISLHQWDRDTVEEFHRLILNTELDADHPVFVMRVAATRHMERTGKRWSAGVTFAAMAKAFNMTLDGTKVQYWRPPTDPDLWPSGVRPEVYLLRNYRT